MTVLRKEEIIIGEDFKRQVLCVNCWNGMHYFKWEVCREVGRTEPIKVIVDSGRGMNVFSNCLEGDCECHCRELRSEKRPRIKHDSKGQLELYEQQTQGN